MAAGNRIFRETADHEVNNDVEGLGGDDWTDWRIIMRPDLDPNGEYEARLNGAPGYRRRQDLVADGENGCGIYELKLYRNRGQEERDNGCIYIHITSIALY